MRVNPQNGFGDISNMSGTQPTPIADPPIGAIVVSVFVLTIFLAAMIIPQASVRVS